MEPGAGVAAGLVDLPSGGGAISPLGDRFQPDLVRGSGGYSVPIPCPKGPNELAPRLVLTYSTGSGNGPFGLGWRLDVPRIARRTDRGVPKYTDDDTFVLGDGEVLVPVGDGLYRPRVERSFWRIRHEGDTGWRIDTGDGWTLRLGQTDAARERPGGQPFAWLLEELVDAAGNAIRFQYVRDGERLYLEEVQYSIFRVRFEYEGRPDVLRDGRAGFERATQRRARAVHVSCERLGVEPMRTYSLGYDEALNGASLLTRIALTAGEGDQLARFPEQRFEYSSLDLTRWRVHALESEVPPPALEERSAQLVDLTGDGLPDVLQAAGARAYLWQNRGRGRFDGPLRLQELPSTLQLSSERAAFADLDGDGRVELFHEGRALALAFESDGAGGFRARPHAFALRPELRLAEPTTRLMDIDGDGVTDLLATERNAFLLVRHVPGRGWQEPLVVWREHDETNFPDLWLGADGVSLADMTGDGFLDFVSVRSGRIRYWPYLGNGVWGRAVAPANPARFPAHYREGDVVVVDVDGDGCADVVHFGAESTRIWLNRCGNGFSEPIELPLRPIAREGAIHAVDLFGDGRPGFAWTAPAVLAGGARQRYVRFDAGRIPYVMTAIENGMGGRTEIEYSSSTELRVEDRESGRDWTGELPFAVALVTLVRERDTLTERESLRRLRYRDGIYDGFERHFRGFEKVTMELSGDDSQPGVRHEYTFFQGDPRAEDASERERQRALAGSLLSKRVLDTRDEELLEEARFTHVAREELVTPLGRILAPLTTGSEVRELPRGDDPVRIERVRSDEHDRFGNSLHRVREQFAEGTPQEEWLGTDERATYSINEDAWLVRFPARKEVRDRRGGAPFVVQTFAYDGAPFEGLPEGSVERGMLTRSRELRLAEARLPQGYLDGRDLTTLGYELTGEGDTRGYYAERLAVERDARGNVVRQRDALGRITEVDYDTDGVYPVAARDAFERETSFLFDPRSGEAAVVDFPDGRTLRFEYDRLGRPAARYELDDVGNEELVQCWVLDVDSAPSSVITITPGSAGRRRSEFVPGVDFGSLAGVSVERLYFSGAGHELARLATAPGSSALRPEERFVDYGRRQRNARGSIFWETAPRFAPGLAPLPADDAGSVRVRYDALGRMVESAGPGPVRARAVRDTFHIRHFEGEGAGEFGAPAVPGDPVRLERFDALGRLQRIEEPLGDGRVIATEYGLASDGRVDSIRMSDDAGVANEVARFVYAGADGPIEVHQRDLGARVYYRDALGRVVERIEPDGSRLFFSFDALGRTTRVEHAVAGSAARELLRETFHDVDPEGSSSGRFLIGRVALVREPSSEIRYSYDRAGRWRREEIAVGGEALVSERVLDFQGRPIALMHPDGQGVEFRHDDSGAVREIPGVVADLRYEPDGATASYRLANGVIVRAERERESRRLVSISAATGAGPLRRVEYRHDAVGHIVELRDEGAGADVWRGFGYDRLHRLASFEVLDAPTQQRLSAGDYAYDALGNLTRIEEERSLSLSYTDPARPGRLSAVLDGADEREIEYDGRGRFLSFGDWAELAYDPLDRLLGVTRRDGLALSFVHDFRNRRLMKEVRGPSTTERVLYAGSGFERHADRSIAHVHLGGALVASFSLPSGAPPSNASATYYVTDHHGSVLVTTDASAAVTRHQRHSPFGLAGMPDPAAVDRFVGRELDAEIGLVQFGARYYAPELGRFITPDWFVVEDPTRSLRIPQGHNPYSYALNDPLTFKDPSGKFFALGSLIGFIGGFSYAVAEGERWDAVLGRAAETSFTTGVGAAMGGHSVLGPLGAVNGAMNGLMSGVHQVYAWDDITGWLAFTADSSLGIVGTASGNQVHFLNAFQSSDYREDLSKRQNRHVYAKGVAVKNGFFFAQGNVVSNAAGNVGLDPNTAEGRLRLRKLDQHETLHIWQNRIAGPVYTNSYVGWLIVGSVTALNTWFADTDDDLGKRIEEWAYRSNPWEAWAFGNVDEHADDPVPDLEPPGRGKQ